MTDNNNSSIPFIGKGWCFPPEFDIGSRSVKVVAGETDIQESLEILLSTQAGERPMNPKFGCQLSLLLFEPLNERLKEQIADQIKMAILQFEPRITVEKVELEFIPLETTVLIHILYYVKTTNSRKNMVFPYYLKEGTNL